MQRRATLKGRSRAHTARATVSLNAKHLGLRTSYAMIARRVQVAPQTGDNHIPELGAIMAVRMPRSANASLSQ